MQSLSYACQPKSQRHMGKIIENYETAAPNPFLHLLITLNKFEDFK